MYYDGINWSCVTGRKPKIFVFLHSQVLVCFLKLLNATISGAGFLFAFVAAHANVECQHKVQQALDTASVPPFCQSRGSLICDVRVELSLWGCKGWWVCCYCFRLLLSFRFSCNQSSVRSAGLVTRLSSPAWADGRSKV